MAWQTYPLCLQMWAGKDIRELTLVYTDCKRLPKRGCKFLGLFVWKLEPSVNWFSTSFSAFWKVVLPPLFNAVKITADEKLTVLVILQLLLGTLRITVKLTRTRSISLCCGMWKPWAAQAQDYSRFRLKTIPTAGGGEVRLVLNMKPPTEFDYVCEYWCP